MKLVKFLPRCLNEHAKLSSDSILDGAGGKVILGPDFLA